MPCDVPVTSVVWDPTQLFPEEEDVMCSDCHILDQAFDEMLGRNVRRTLATVQARAATIKRGLCP